MREIRKVIWATDGSKESEEALNYARFFAQRFNSEIIGVHVIPMPEVTIYDFLSDSAVELKMWTEKIEEGYKGKLASIGDELRTQGINFRGEILRGEPNKEIVKFAHSEKADLIVMGKRGHGLVDRILVGSTTIKVLRETNISVLAVGKKDKGRTIEIRNILVPLDVNESVDSALNYAIDLAEKINASISVLYVLYISEHELYTSYYDTLYKVVEGLIKRYSYKLVKRVEEAKLKCGIGNKESDKLEINTEVIQGINPSMRIVEYATSKNADLIVIHTHGRKGFKKFILGSVTEKLIQESHCAVLVVRP